MNGFGATLIQNDSSLYLYNDEEENRILQEAVIRILQIIVSIPELKLILKFTMPMMVWLEDFHYYSYHLYDYNDGVIDFLLLMHRINQQKINPSLAYVA